MKPYHKVHSVFKRDQAGAFLPVWSRPEFDVLRDLTWQWTEKVDGTNIRIEVHPDGRPLRIGGRTDNAQIPTFLLDAIHALDIPGRAKGLRGPVILYGEGYGPKIQKGGGNYRSTPGFVLFDVMAGDYWLERPDVWTVADMLGLDEVPFVGGGSLLEAVDRAREGFDSAWGDFPAEGLVMRPTVQLFNRQGHRIIAKAKTRDRFAFDFDKFLPLKEG